MSKQEQEQELEQELELELEQELTDPGIEPGPLVQDLFRSLLEPSGDHAPLVASYSRIRLVNLFCAPCESFIGWVASYEASDRLPDHLPYYILTCQIPATETEGALPEYRRGRVILNCADDPWLQQLMNLHPVSPPPDELTTHCRKHGGALTFTRRAVLGWAMEARKRILEAEERGDTPRATRRKLRPPIVSAV